MIRTLLVLPDGTEIFSGPGTDNAILSTTVTESVNSGQELTLGSVCAAALEVRLWTPGGSLAIAAGDEIAAWQVTDEGDRRLLGIFIAEKPTRPTAHTVKLTAYDRISLLDRDLTGWLSGLTGWPYSLFALADMVCRACGLELVNTQLPNGSYPVQKFSAEGITGRQLMQWIGQAAGRFCRATAEGKVEFSWYETLYGHTIGALPETGPQGNYSPETATLTLSGMSATAAAGVLTLSEVYGTAREGVLLLSGYAAEESGGTLTVSGIDATEESGVLSLSGAAATVLDGVLTLSELAAVEDPGVLTLSGVAAAEEGGVLTLEDLQAEALGGTLTLSQTRTRHRIFRDGLSFEDYRVAPIEKVQIQASGEDVGVIWPQVDQAVNTYRITGNLLLRADRTEELLPVAQALYEQLRSVTYTPCTVSIPAQPEIRPGHILWVTDRNGKRVCMYVMEQTRTGQKMKLTCTGSPSRESTSAVNAQSYAALSGKVLNLRTAVEGLWAENRAADGRAAALSLTVDGIAAQVEKQNSDTGHLQTRLTRLEQTAEAVQISVKQIREQGVSRVTTEASYTFDDKGLRIAKSGEQMENLLDNTGMYVSRSGESILQANADGVCATDVQVRNYLCVGENARFEDYESGRTACFFTGGA